MYKLVKLIKKQDLKRLESYLSKKDVSLATVWLGKDKIPVCPIGLAVQTGNLDLVKILINYGSPTNHVISTANLNFASIDIGLTNPLFYAITSKNPEMVALLTRSVTDKTDLNYSYSWVHSSVLNTKQDVISGPNLMDLALKIGDPKIIDHLKKAHVKKCDLLLELFNNNIKTITQKQADLEEKKQKLIRMKKIVTYKMGQASKDSALPPRKPPSKFGT